LTQTGDKARLLRYGSGFILSVGSTTQIGIVYDA